MNNRVQKLLLQLGIQHPIIQAPMAGGITTPELVSAVSKTGALGSFGAAYMRPDELRQAINTVRQATSCPYQVNLFVPDTSTHYHPLHHSKALQQLKTIYTSYGLDFAKASAASRDDFDDQIKVVLEEKTPIVSFTFGIPDIKILSQLRQAGVLLMGTATCVAEARILAQAQFDIIVVQGFEAGGHRATFHSTLKNSKTIPNIGLFALLPQIVDCVDVPVIASGGIMDGRAIRAALELGASGVQLGTAFMGCPEAALPISWRKALRKSKDTDTVLTKTFSGRFARGIKNSFIEDMDDVRDNLPPFPALNSLTGPLRTEAKRRDDQEYQSLWAGQAASLTRSLPVQELMAALLSEMSLSDMKR